MSDFVEPSAPAPPISVVIVSFNTQGELLRCLESLAECVSLPIEVVVVDNASKDGTVDALRRDQPRVRLIANSENVGFARACNQGLRAARGSLWLILNSDTEIRPGAVEALADALERNPKAGLAGPRTLNSDGTLQASFGLPLTLVGEWRQRRLMRGLRSKSPDALRRLEEAWRDEREPAWISGSCLLARRTALEEVGLFDEGFFLYEEDVDLCLRLRRAGWQILRVSEAEVIHHLGRSMRQVPGLASLEYQRSHLRYYRKHNGPVQTALLRAWLLASASGSWLAALGPGHEREERRRMARDLLWLAGGNS